MKQLYKAIIGMAVVIAAGFSINSCTDPLKFGNAFLEKAPGGTVTADTVFSSAEYTQQFLAAIYSRQYHPLPVRSSNDPPQCLNYWKGMPDALSDTHQLYFTSTIVYQYYTGAITSTTDSNNNGNIYPFLNEYIWDNVRDCYLLMEHIEDVPDLTDNEKARMTDQAKCLLVNAYFVAFRYYGGLPLIYATFSGDESSYNYPRASVEETVNFMVDILDEVIDADNLDWAYPGTTDAATETGRWTIAGAMALKCKILQFAASPLFNDTEPYWQGTYTLEDPYVAWYGNYSDERWTRFRDACAEFFNRLNTEGSLQLVVPAGATQEDYRYAYRSSYMLQNSTEVIHSVRTSTSANGNDYQWYNLKDNNRYSYCPTQEYVEMFPWADGRPFDWDETEAAGELDHMFVQGDTVAGYQMLQNRVYTRDPRLYENVAVNGALQTINWSDGYTSGANYECWVGGTTAGQEPINQTNHYGTGYRYLKYLAGDAFQRQFPQFVWLSLSEMYLNYAEALAQTGNLSDAVKYVNDVRARVGLGGIDEFIPEVLTDKDTLLEEILRERACEMCFNDSRYHDLIRYKRSYDFEKPLHRLLIYRLVKNDDGEWERSETQWYNTRTNYTEDDPDNYYEPSYFDYEKAEIDVAARIWWTQGFDPKWYLQPFPINELNKGYGLIQNPGW